MKLETLKPDMRLEHEPDVPAHPRGELRRMKRVAHREELFGVGLGVSLILIGLVSAVFLRVYHWWPVLLVMLGPILVFLSFMGFFTFLERVEEDKYFPDSFKRKEVARGEFSPGAWNP